MVGSHGLIERLKWTQYITFLFKITFMLAYELHSSIYIIQSEEHVHILNELHITIQSAGHQKQSHLGKKG